MSLGKRDQAFIGWVESDHFWHDVII